MKKVTTKEFVWYLICGLIAFLGLVALVFGIVGYHMGGPEKLNFIHQFELKINFELRYIGLILIGASVALSIIVLLFNAKNADREVEKKLRREQRIAAQSNKTIEVKNAVEVIEEPTPETGK
jgi:hypothetical protein